jgi:hypothetical protein
MKWRASRDDFDPASPFSRRFPLSIHARSLGTTESIKYPSRGRALNSDAAAFDAVAASARRHGRDRHAIAALDLVSPVTGAVGLILAR